MHIVQYLLEEIKVDIDEQASQGESALHRACYRNRKEIAKYLVMKHNANTELREKVPNSMILTPMFRAIEKERIESIELLL